MLDIEVKKDVSTSTFSVALDNNPIKWILVGSVLVFQILFIVLLAIPIQGVRHIPERDILGFSFANLYIPRS